LNSSCLDTFLAETAVSDDYASPPKQKTDEAGIEKIFVTCTVYTKLMSPPLSRRKMLASAVTGMSCLTGCQGWTGSATPGASDESETDEDNESLGLVFSKSRTSFPSEEEAHSGWVHIVSDGESADLTFDVRLCRELGDVEPELTRSIANEFVLRFNVTSEFGSGTSSTGKTEESACSSVVHLVGGANVPSDWETLTVAVNDVEIQTIERSGTMPELRPLPDPVRLR
jgi:hypothetical protein